MPSEDFTVLLVSNCSFDPSIRAVRASVTVFGRTLVKAPSMSKKVTRANSF